MFVAPVTNFKLVDINFILVKSCNNNFAHASYHVQNIVIPSYSIGSYTYFLFYTMTKYIINH